MTYAEILIKKGMRGAAAFVQAECMSAKGSAAASSSQSPEVLQTPVHLQVMLSKNISLYLIVNCEGFAWPSASPHQPWYWWWWDCGVVQVVGGWRTQSWWLHQECPGVQQHCHVRPRLDRQLCRLQVSDLPHLPVHVSLRRVLQTRQPRGSRLQHV